MGIATSKIECHIVNPCIKVITITRATRKTHCMSKIHTCPQKCVSGAKYTKMQETFKIGYHKVSPTCKQAKGSTYVRSKWTGTVQSAISKSEFSRRSLTGAIRSHKHATHSHIMIRDHKQHSQGASHHNKSKYPHMTPKMRFWGNLQQIDVRLGQKTVQQTLKLTRLTLTGELKSPFIWAMHS